MLSSRDCSNGNGDIIIMDHGGYTDSCDDSNHFNLGYDAYYYDDEDVEGDNEADIECYNRWFEQQQNICRQRQREHERQQNLLEDHEHHDDEAVHSKRRRPKNKDTMKENEESSVVRTRPDGTILKVPLDEGGAGQEQVDAAQKRKGSQGGAGIVRPGNDSALLAHSHD
jgi:hypothetical protein